MFFFLSSLSVFLPFIVTFGTSEVIDLTWGFSNTTIYWVGSENFTYTKQFSTEERGYWYSANEFCAAEHGGTHIDAPYHFNKNGWKVADIPVERLIVRASLVDVSQDVEEYGNDFELLPKHLENWEKEFGSFPNNSVLLVKFGWSKYWSNRIMYLGINGNKLNFPSLSTAAAQWIIDTGKFYGVGVDVASIDTGKSTEFLVHQTFCNHQMFALENVKIARHLPSTDLTLIISPMKLEEGTGAPVRVFAVPTVLHL